MRTGSAVIVAALVAGLASAEREPGSGTIGFQLGFYSQPDDGGTAGNPFLDEELTVIEPVVVFDYQVDEDDSIWALISYDNVSSASIDRLSRFPAQSGASGDYYFGADVGWRRQLDAKTSRGFFGSASVEYDYVSLGIGGDYTREAEEGGRQIRLNGSAFVDTIDVIRFDGSEDGTDQRLTVAGGVAWYQPISPTLHGTMGASLTFQNGFLETAYNAVVVEDGSGPNPNLVGNARGREVVEELPDTRIRASFHGKLKQAFGADAATELGGRLYADDWGIVGLTVEPALDYWLVPDEHLLRLHYRFYTQTAADAYQERFTTVVAERTQDADLADFNANTVGATWRWTLDDEAVISTGFEFTTRSDDLDFMTIRAGYERPF